MTASYLLLGGNISLGLPTAWFLKPLPVASAQEAEWTEWMAAVILYSFLCSPVSCRIEANGLIHNSQL